MMKATSMGQWFILTLAVLIAMQASAAPNYERSEVPLPDKEEGEDLTAGETEVPSEERTRDLTGQLTNLDLEDSEVIDMADFKGEEVGAIVKRSNPVVSTKLVLGIVQSQLSGTVSDYSGIGYRPHFIDAYTVGSTTYFNVIFREKISGEYWRWYYGLESSTYQDKFDQMSDLVIN